MKIGQIEKALLDKDDKEEAAKSKIYDYGPSKLKMDKKNGKS